MEMLKSKSIIVFVIMILGVSYMSAIDGSYQNTHKGSEVISEQA